MPRGEFLYVLHSKAWMLLLAALFAAGCLTVWNMNGALRGAHAQYIYAREDAAANGQNPDALMSSPAHVKVTMVNGTRVSESDNPVRLAADGVATALKELAPHNLIPTAMGIMMLIVGPLAFSAWGVFFGTYDYANGTVKVKALSGSWARAVLTKLMVNAVVVAAVIAIVLALIEVVARAVYYYELNYALPNAQTFLSSAVGSSPNVLMQYVVCVVVGVLFSSIGIALGVLFRRTYPALAVVAIYNMFLPSLGAYDLKNVVAVVMRSAFAFDASAQVIAAVPVSLWAAYSVVALLIGVSVLTSWIAAGRQSKFVAA